MFSKAYFGGSGDDYDPVGERGIKFSNCRIYTIVTSESNNLFPLTQGALNTTRSGSNVYEPGLVKCGRPTDLLGNSITKSNGMCRNCSGDITSSVPAYVLPTIVRNRNNKYLSALGAATTYQ